jgi:hypothetical protein
MHSISFHNKSHEQLFSTEGILDIPFITKLDVELLLQLYHQTPKDNLDNRFHSTMFFDSVDYRKKTSSAILAILGNKIENLLLDYHVLFANFIVKEPNGDTSVGIHQDWSFTSPEYLSLNIWIPLCDINEQTGLFYGLKQSQKVFKNIRYTPYENDRYSALEPIIRANSTAYKINAGSALIYDGALVHYSDSNRSNQSRIAIGIVIIPKLAPNFHYYKKNINEKCVEIYKVNDSFYTTFDIFKKPENVTKFGELSDYPGLPSALELSSIYRKT